MLSDAVGLPSSFSAATILLFGSLSSSSLLLHLSLWQLWHWSEHGWKGRFRHKMGGGEGE